MCVCVKAYVLGRGRSPLPKSEQISPIEVDLMSEIVSMDVLTYALDEFQGILFLTSPSLFLWTRVVLWRSRIWNQ